MEELCSFNWWIRHWCYVTNQLKITLNLLLLSWVFLVCSLREPLEEAVVEEISFFTTIVITPADTLIGAHFVVGPFIIPVWWAFQVISQLFLRCSFKLVSAKSKLFLENSSYKQTSIGFCCYFSVLSVWRFSLDHVCIVSDPHSLWTLRQLPRDSSIIRPVLLGTDTKRWNRNRPFIHIRTVV